MYMHFYLIMKGENSLKNLFLCVCCNALVNNHGYVKVISKCSNTIPRHLQSLWFTSMIKSVSHYAPVETIGYLATELFLSMICTKNDFRNHQAYLSINGVG